MLMEQEEDQLRNFARHCHAFYLSSLSPASSSSSSSSLDEEAAIANNTCNDLDQITTNGKIVLEAFDRICAIVAINDALTAVQEGSLTNLKNEHDLCAQRNCDLLKECGLLEIDQFTTLNNAAILIQKYTEVRDASRREAHKSAMTHRHNSFFELLSRAEQDCDTTYSVEACNFSTEETSSNRTTTVDGIKAIISSIDMFVTKYQLRIGSHSFLAGLHKFIQLQLTPTSGIKTSNSDPSYVVQWTFCGSVLTEACLPTGADKDELSYAREALKILFMFMIISKTVDIEGGSQGDAAEPMVSFEIHKHVSNATLRRILNVLPNPKDLDARPTGTLKVLTNVALRENVDGHLDEHWSLFQSNFLTDYCTVL